MWLAFCSGSPAPICLFLRMTIIFENDKDIIIYALKKIISFARKNQYIFFLRKPFGG